MAIQNEPTRISTPFADAGTKNVIPETMAQPSATAAASWQAGFPTVCSLPLSAGGIPPARNDFNGLLNQMTQTERFLQDGGIFAWDASTDYGANRLVLGSDGKLYWSVAQSGPNTGAGAVDPTTDSGAYWGQLPVTATEAAEAAYSSVAGGFVSWSNADDYAVSQIVLGSDGLVYMAKAASGPGTTAGAKDPAADTAHVYWVPPRVTMLPANDSSNAAASTQWVNSWFVNNRILPPTLWVDGVNGNDSNDGLTSSTPKKTITAAVDLLKNAEYIKYSTTYIDVKAADYSSEVLGGVPGVNIAYHFTGGTSIVGSAYANNGCQFQIGGDVTFNGSIFSANGGIITIGWSNANTTITFNNVDSAAALRTQSGAYIRTLYESNSISIAFTGTCSFWRGTILADINCVLNLEFKNSGRISWSGTVSGQKYYVNALGSIVGTGPEADIPGTGKTVNNLGYASA